MIDDAVGFAECAAGASTPGCRRFCVFVVFEGIDGAGKTSQLRWLVNEMQESGRCVVSLLEPTRGQYGSEIRTRAQHGPPMTPEEELALFVKDRRENVEQNILPALAADKDVVQDRYYYSTAAHQAARPELKLTPAAVVAMHDWAPRPDIVILLDLPVAVGLSRVIGRGSRTAFEHEELQHLVRAGYLELSELDDRFRIINAEGSETQVAKAVLEAVSEVLLA